ncbi:hypothetical protein [Orenia marismortui]|nr:hypothetical protein [Orenia marismortui]
MTRLLYVFCLIIIPLIIIRFLIPLENKGDDKNNLKKVVEYRKSKIFSFTYIIIISFLAFHLYFFPTDNSLYSLNVVVMATYLIATIDMFKPITVVDDNYLLCYISFFGEAKIRFENISCIKMRQRFLGIKHIDVICKLGNDSLENNKKIKVRIFNLENTEKFIKDIVKSIEGVEFDENVKKIINN